MDVLNIQLMNRKNSCQSYIFFTPGFIWKVKVGKQLCSCLENTAENGKECVKFLHKQLDLAIVNL